MVSLDAVRSELLSKLNISYKVRLRYSGCEEVTGGKGGRPVTLFIIVLVKADADYVIHVCGMGL